MRQAQYPDFPLAEYQQRYSRLRIAMEIHHLDAILISNRTNHRYFSGFCAEVFALYHYYFFAPLPREDALDPVFFCTNAFPVAATTWIQDMRVWDWPRNRQMSKESAGVKLVADVLSEKGLGEATIGMELSSDMHVHMGGNHVLRLRELMPKIKWADGSDAMMEVRAVKSLAEIQRLRKAARISAEAVRFGFESLEAGTTEVELMQKMAARCYELGATDIRYMTNYAGPRRMWLDATPTYYKIQRRDLVQFDGGCLVDGCWCEFKRMCAIGKPKDDYRRDYDIAREGIEGATVVLKAGV